MKTIINAIFSGLNKVLDVFGRTLNQTPTPEELKHVPKVGSQETPPWKKRHPRTKESSVQARKAQGKRNKDAEFFNHPRKDISSGRQNQ